MSISGMTRGTIVVFSRGTISTGCRPRLVRGIHGRISVCSSNWSRGMGWSSVHPSGILIGRHLRNRHPWGRVRYMAVSGEVGIAAELGRICVAAVGTITISSRISSLSIRMRFFVSA
jgi:hypothetical protein